MPRQLRWQVALAAIGVATIGVLLSLFANRTFVDRPARGGHVAEVLVGKPAVLNPLFAVKDSEITLARLLFAGLTRPSGDGGVVPDLASQWDLSEDGRTYRFLLRKGLTFHDGSPLTADDVVFTAELAKDRRLSGQLSREALLWSEITASKIDDHTVSFTLDEPLSPFLASTVLGILPRHLLADVSPDQLAQHRFSTLEPVGAGPFRLVTPGGIDESAVRLARFDTFWSATASQPFLEGINFEFASSAEDAVETLGRHTVQAAGDLPGQALDGVSDSAVIYAASEPGYTLIYLNHRRVLFNDAAVRRALSLAIDRNGLIADSAILAGQGIPAAGPIARGSWAFDTALEPPQHNPAQARRILEEAEWVDSDANNIRDREGKSLSVSLGVGNDPVLLAVAERIRGHWTDIGVEVQVRPMDQQTVRRVLTEHSYDAMVFDWALRDYDPDPFPLWHSSQIEGGQNFSAWTNGSADELLASARQTSDRATRTELYRQFQRLFAMEQPALVLYHPLYTYALVEGEVGGVQLPALVVNPSDRLLNVRDWYVETERVLLDGRSAQ